jgi:hypothetical protein
VLKRVEKRGWGDESRAQKGDHLPNISVALTSMFDGSGTSSIELALHCGQ